MVGKGLILLSCTVFAGYHMASETVLSRFGTNCFRKLATMFAHSHVYNQSWYVFCACCVTVKTAILCLCVAQNAPTLQHHLVTKNQYYFCTSKHSTAYCNFRYVMQKFVGNWSKNKARNVFAKSKIARVSRSQLFHDVAK